MRVSSADINRLAINGILEQQAKLAKIQQQIATGERVLTPADDPVASVRVLDLTESKETTAQYQRNADVATTRLNMEEVVLTESIDVMQRVRELALQSDSDVLNSDDRIILAQELQLLVGRVVELSNSKDATGEYLFAGYQARTEPYSNTGGTYVYNGDEGQRFLQVGPSRQIAVGDPGDAVFGDIKQIQANAAPTNQGTATVTAGNVIEADDYQAHNFTIEFTSATTYRVTNNTTGQVVITEEAYSTGQPISFNGVEVTVSGDPLAGDTFTVAPDAPENIFNALNGLIQALESGADTAAELDQMHADINSAITDIDQALNSLSTHQTTIGARLNAIDSQKQTNESFDLQLEKTISELKDLDYTEAISRFSLQMVAMQAAQQAYVKMQGLSLFSFLR